MFLSIWLHFKKCFGKYFLMFGCILENTIEKTFSTCYSYFLTFSQLPNEYIISFIPKNTNKTQKISHFLGEIAILKIQIKPRKYHIFSVRSWSRSARSRSARSQSRSCDRRDRNRDLVIGAIARCIDRNHDRRRSARFRWSRSRSTPIVLSLFR